MNPQFEEHKKRRIEICIKGILGNYYSWEKPDLTNSIGPSLPNAFEQFSNFVDACHTRLREEFNGLSLSHIDLLYDSSGNSLSNPLSANSPEIDFQKEIGWLKENEPPWFAGGFGHPDYQADFNYWAKMASLTVDEAVLLSIGVDPNLVTTQQLLSHEDNTCSDFLEKRMSLFFREFHRRQEPHTLGLFLQWFEQTQLEVPSELLEEFRRVERGPVLEEIPQKLDNREKSSMAKIIIVMAVDGYGYEPSARKSPIPKEIQDRAARLGLDISDDTIRRYLKMGAELLPEDWNTD